MSGFRSVLVVAAGGILVACTFTRSLDYLTEGPPEPSSSSSGSSSTSTSSSSSGVGSSGAPAGTVLAADQASPKNLAQDGDSVYWTTDAKKLLRVPKVGGATQELVVLPSAVLGIAVDPSPGGNVFILLTDGTMQSVPKTGGALAPFAGIAKGTALAVDDTSLFVTIENADTVEGALLRYPKGGGAGTRISPAGEDTLGDVILVGASVFWSSSTADGTLVVNEQPRTATSTVPAKVYKNTALDEGEVYGIDPTKPGQIAIDEGAIYWIDEYIGKPLRLPRMPGAGDALPLVQSSEIVPTALAVDANYIYITSPSDGKSQIVRIAKAGGAPDALAPQPNPKAIITDDSAIYVAFSGTGVNAVGGVQKIPTK